MALHVPKAPGFAQMLKDGAKVGLLKQSFVCVVMFLYRTQWLHIEVSRTWASQRPTTGKRSTRFRLQMKNNILYEAVITIMS